jgi:hypothetical protein
MEDVAYRASITTVSIRQVIAYNYLCRLISVWFSVLHSQQVKKLIDYISTIQREI